MSFKTTFTIIALAILLISCKTQNSVIVTSKQEAQKLGIYEAPSEKKQKTKSKVTKPIETDEIVITEVVSPDVIVEENVSEDSVYQVTQTGLSYQGVPYRTGGTTTSGMDCSGFVIACYKKIDTSLPRTSTEMSKSGIRISKSEAKKGDLIFFKTNGRSVINHVGIVLEVIDDEIKFIHSSTSKGVIISTTKESYYGKNFAQINRIIE